MANLLRSELYKLYKEPSFRILCFTFIFVAVILSGVIHFMGSGQKVFSGISGLGQGVQVNTIVLKVSLAVVGGFFLSGEHGLGIMKISVASGYSRRQIYTAKLTAYSIGIIILSLIVPVICVIAGSLLNGFEASRKFLPPYIYFVHLPSRYYMQLPLPPWLPCSLSQQQ